ncbi:MAG TPA: hypothetical protein VFI02_20170, partial [Armatimonadota bacterium]|nr:hypothetical protein [Armatimonadota bacterium]
CVFRFLLAGEVIGVVYDADTPFPEFMHLWQEGWSLKDANGERLLYSKTHLSFGGYVFVYFRNTGSDPVTVTDLLVQGIKLSEGIGVAETTTRAEDKFGASVLLSKLPKEKMDVLKTAGQPVWWKAELAVVPPGRGKSADRHRDRKWHHRRYRTRQESPAQIHHHSLRSRPEDDLCVHSATEAWREAEQPTRP